MATAGSNATANAGIEANGNSNVPQWKRDLIQRRRQQSKVLASNGASVKLCSAVIGTSSDTANVDQHATAVQEHCQVAGTLRPVRSTTSNENTAANVVAVCGADSSAGGSNGSASGGNALLLPSSLSSFPARRPPSTSGATIVAATTAADFTSPVAHNMRLEADLSLCSDAEDIVNSASAKFATDTSERKSLEYTSDAASENEQEAQLRTLDGGKVRSGARTSSETSGENTLTGSQRDGIRLVGGKDCQNESMYGNRTMRKESPRVAASSRASNEDAESDSSEELQYGPGIVNKLKSKYLNLTLRETNKSCASVQRFRRAASLEDLLDRDDDETCAHEKIATARKYTKRDGPPSGSGGVIVPKSDRYRNASRGNDSMKRARSVETLMRYNGAPTDEMANAVRSILPGARPATNGVRQEPVNDHIILVDRTSVKIESRLGDLDRPKPINKPKRIKPVLAETERPPPDLVKTTMRIFEGSARKLKPKGEVAAKVATFKTINDTFKAQKKLMPKPPVQPKTFLNGSARGGTVPGSPKKIILRKSTAELIETQGGEDEYHIDGVITEPIVQSVSSVVSKFQQIEKSHSPSPSPEPSSYQKLKFSPANSPEPPTAFSCKLKASALEITVKSPPVTPVLLSPRISSPRMQSPSSPSKDSNRFQTSAVKEAAEVESLKPLRPQTTEKESARMNIEYPRPPRLPESLSTNTERKEDTKSIRVAPNDMSLGNVLGEEEIVGGQKTITKAALDNISKAGTTMQFNFDDKSTVNKSYLPGTKQNGQKLPDERTPEGDHCVSAVKTVEPSVKSASVSVAMTTETTSRLQERLEEEKVDNDKEDVEEKPIVPESKPIGAICSLGLIKPAATTTTTITTTTTAITTTTTTTTHHLQSNEAKTIRCQKSEFSPPQKQIGIIRPLVSTKTQHTQQNLSNRELEKNLINRVKSIEQPTKVVVSLKSADEIQPAKKASVASGGGSGGGGGGLWDTKPWNQQNNTMVFNFSNRKDVPDYIENDGLIIRRKREKPKVGDGGIIVLDATLDASTTDDAEWEISGGPPSPCDVSFLNDNVLINGRSNLSRTPRNHKHRIQFDDTATRTFEYPSEASILEGETSSVDGETSSSVEQQSPPGNNKASTAVSSAASMPSLLGGSGLASYTPSKVDLTSEGFELGVTRTLPMIVHAPTPSGQTENASEVEYLRPAQDAGAWGSETTGDLLY